MSNEENIPQSTQTWRERIVAIEGEIAKANAVIHNADVERSRIAMAVITGDATEMDQARHRLEVAQARDGVDDRKLVLAAARNQLAKLETIERAERRRAAREQAKELIERRKQVAANFDAAAKQMQIAFVEFEELAHEILNNPDAEFNHPNMSIFENIRGRERVAGALPPLMRTLFPNMITGDFRGGLAASEGGAWHSIISN